MVCLCQQRYGVSVSATLWRVCVSNAMACLCQQRYGVSVSATLWRVCVSNAMACLYQQYYLFQRGWEVELTCRCLFFLLRVHHLQLTRSQSILPILHSLSTHTSTQVTDLKVSHSTLHQATTRTHPPWDTPTLGHTLPGTLPPWEHPPWDIPTLGHPSLLLLMCIVLTRICMD